MSRILLLVDSTVRNYTDITAAVKSDVTTVVFDGSADTYASILSKVAAATTTPVSYSTVGLIQHGDAISPEYTITRVETPAFLSDTTTWGGVSSFFAALKAAYATTTVDLISCMIYSNPAWVSALSNLESATGLNFRASKDATGNLANGGNWVMESDNVNIEGIYFTEAIKQFTGMLYYTIPRKTSQMVSSSNPLSIAMVSASNPVAGMTRVTTPASIVTWGLSPYGGDSSSVAAGLSSNIVAIASNNFAFAALKDNGAVVTWGVPVYGGDSSSVAASLASGVIAIASANSAFAALKVDGAVVAWGDSEKGGSVPSNLDSDVVAIASCDHGFAALKSDGTVVTWGSYYHFTGSYYQLPSSASISGVVSIASTGSAFAGLKLDKTVVAWGDTANGGSANLVGSLLTNVSAIASNKYAFAALKSDGSVVAWGNSTYGGNVGSQGGALSNNVVAIASNASSFAALKANGSVVTWGYSFYGGSSTLVGNLLSSGVNAITSTNSAYAALKEGGFVVLWGDDYSGANGISVAGAINSGVISIASTESAFSALKSDGSVVAWGNSYTGGSIGTATAGDLSSGVTAIASTNNAFAAIKNTGSVVTWGNSFGGANSSAVSGSLVRVSAIASNSSSFAAFRSPPVTTPAISVTSGSASLVAGGSLTLSVSSPYPGAIYQWYKDSSSISSASNTSYSIQAAVLSDAGIYKVVQTVNGSPLESSTLTITVYSPTISSDTPTPYVGNNITLSLSLVGEPSVTPAATYQWYKNSSEITRATDSTYTINTASTTDSGDYYVRWSNTVNSNTLTIDVSPPARLATNSLFTATDGHQYKVLANNTAVTLWSIANGGAGAVTLTETVADENAVAYTLVQVGDINGPHTVPSMSGSTLTSLVLPSTVTAIGYYAFWRTSSLLTITGSGVTHVYEEAFMGCESLHSINLPAVSVISPRAFTMCSGLIHVHLPNVTQIGDHAFRNSQQLAYVYLPNVTHIVASAFILCESLKGIYVDINEGDLTIEGIWNMTPSASVHQDFAIYYQPNRTWSSALATPYGGTIPCIAYNPSVSLSTSTASPAAGASITLTASFTPAGLGATYRFSHETGLLGTAAQASNNFSISSLSSSNSGFYNVGATDVFGMGLMFSPDISITVSPPPPVITSQPVGGALSNGSLTLTVVAENVGSYEWYKRPDADPITMSPIAQSNSNSASFTATSAGTYFVKVFATGHQPVQSNDVLVLAPPPPPTITVQPVGGNMVNGSYTLTLTAENAVSYQLDRGTPRPSSPGNYLFSQVGQDSPTPSFAITTAGVYRILVGNGQEGVYSNIVTVTNIAPIIITLHPASSSIVAGASPATLTVTATGEGTVYQWYTGEGTTIAGATFASYTPPIITSAGSYSYYVIIRNVAGSVQSNIATITVTAPPPPIITVQPVSGNMITGVSTYKLSVVAPTATAYQWYTTVTATGTGSIIPGASSPIYTVSQTTPATLFFYVVVSNAGGSTTSSRVQVSVLPFGAPINITPNNFESLTLSTTPVRLTSASRNYMAKGATPSGSGATRIATVDAGTLAGVPTPPITYSNIPSSIASVQTAVTTPLRNERGKMELYINTVMKDVDGNVVSNFSATGGITITFPCPPSLLDGAGTPSFSLYEIDDTTNQPTLVPTSNITYNPTTGMITATVQHFSEKMIENNSSSNVVCFPAGERVLTTTGYRAVEDLRRGDRLVTADGRSVSAVVYRLSVPHATEKTAPYHIPAHTFGRNSPPADIRLSPQHAFQIGKGLWHIPAAAAQTYSAISQYGVGEPITYYHLELPNYFTDNIVMEGGAVVESFAYRQVPRGARIYTYNAARDAYTRPRSAKDVIGKSK